MSSFALSPAQEKQLLTEVRRDLVASMILNHGDRLTLLSPAQVAGMLDVKISTLFTFGIPRIELAPKVIRYRIADVEAYLEKQTFRPGRSV